MTTLEEQLRQSLALVRGDDAPLPLQGINATRQALALWRDGLSYRSIALVMSRYHGLHKRPDQWRHRLRKHGAEPRHYTDGSRRMPPRPS